MKKEENKKNIKSSVLLFIRVLCISFIILTIGARFMGLTPKQFNPIPWDIIFEHYLLDIFWMSLVLSFIASIGNYLSIKK